ncbi:MFS general substrate transporter [Testicularia cyperi]|uniref:MFS general substrate transporter n=1 Tax=Testicularia cyperi TaxID=1882483 RepID=A0A317XJ00_9BASI|nr:MFS general substrate transporter [Testicularia cyperi]
MSAYPNTPPDMETASSDEKHITHEAGAPSALYATEKNPQHFDPKVVARIRRKIDFAIVPIVALLYLFCFIDRANIGNARIAGFERDLGMNPRSYQYNIVLTSFYVAYTVFEIPSTALTKILGPGRWIPAMTFMFGLLSMVMAFVHSYGAAIAVRFLLGIAEAGMLPSIAYYLSRWYTKDELTLRLGLYILTAPSAGAFGGLLASGILKIRGIGSVRTWEQIFLIEGIITIGIAVIGYFLMTDSIRTARFLTEEEKEIAENRLKAEMVGQPHLVDKAKRNMLFKGILSPTSLACALMFLFDNIVVQGIAVFLPTIVRGLYPAPRYTVIRQQLLTVPPNVAGAFAVLIIAYSASKFRVRSVLVFISALFMLTGYAMFLGSTNLNVRYAAAFVTCMGAFAQGALLPAWAAANTNNDTERAGAIGSVVMAGNLGGLISTWTYLPKDAPNYVPGNALNVAGGSAIAIISVLLVLWQRWENRQRDAGRRSHRLEGLSTAEIELLGSSHPDFRLRY